MVEATNPVKDIGGRVVLLRLFIASDNLAVFHRRQRCGWPDWSLHRGETHPRQITCGANSETGLIVWAGFVV